MGAKHLLRLRIVLPAVLALMLAPATGWCELDTIYLANGQEVRGKVQAVTGEYIEYRTTTGALGLLKRIQLASRRDILETNKDRRYLGEVRNMGAFTIDIATAQGYKEVWRLFKKRMILGIPKDKAQDLAGQEFIESDRQLQAPPKLFPEP